MFFQTKSLYFAILVTLISVTSWADTHILYYDTNMPESESASEEALSACNKAKANIIELLKAESSKSDLSIENIHVAINQQFIMIPLSTYSDNASKVNAFIQQAECFDRVPLNKRIQFHFAPHIEDENSTFLVVTPKLTPEVYQQVAEYESQLTLQTSLFQTEKAETEPSAIDSINSEEAMDLPAAVADISSSDGQTFIDIFKTTYTENISMLDESINKFDSDLSEPLSQIEKQINDINKELLTLFEHDDSTDEIVKKSVASAQQLKKIHKQISDFNIVIDTYRKDFSEFINQVRFSMTENNINASGTLIEPNSTEDQIEIKALTISTDNKIEESLSILVDLNYRRYDLIENYEKTLSAYLNAIKPILEDTITSGQDSLYSQLALAGFNLINGNRDLLYYGADISEQTLISNDISIKLFTKVYDQAVIKQITTNKKTASIKEFAQVNAVVANEKQQFYILLNNGDSIKFGNSELLNASHLNGYSWRPYGKGFIIFALDFSSVYYLDQATAEEIKSQLSDVERVIAAYKTAGYMIAMNAAQIFSGLADGVVYLQESYIDAEFKKEFKPKAMKKTFDYFTDDINKHGNVVKGSTEFINSPESLLPVIKSITESTDSLF